jgi:hypothetical protein
MKYQLKVIVNTIQSKWVKHYGQVHNVKSAGTQGKVLLQQKLTLNIKLLVYTIQKIQPSLKFSIIGQTPTSRSNLLVPIERSYSKNLAMQG